MWEVGRSGCHSSSMLSARRAGIRGRQILDGRAGAEVPEGRGGGPSVCVCVQVRGRKGHLGPDSSKAALRGALRGACMTGAVALIRYRSQSGRRDARQEG